MRIWRRGERGQVFVGAWANSAPKKALERLQELVRDLGGVEIVIETQEGEHRIHVDLSDARELVEIHERRARTILEVAAALREGRAPVLEDADPNLQELLADYQERKFHLRKLSTKYGVGTDRVRSMLARERCAIRAKRRMRISEYRGPELAAKALRAFDDGASARSVAKILGVTHTSALRFLRSNGRDTRPAAERELPRLEPPRSPNVMACEQWATCA